MTSPELENLVHIGRLKRDPSRAADIEGLTNSGGVRLADAGQPGLSLESRFDLAYNAVYMLARAALMRLGYRCEDRTLAFQTLPHTLGISLPASRILVRCDEMRNLSEHGGPVEIGERLVAELIQSASDVWEALRAGEG